MNSGDTPVWVSSIVDTVVGYGELPDGTLNCGDYSATQLAVGATINCTYTNVLVGPGATSNQVTVTLNTGDDFTTSTPINWNEAVVTKVNDSASVSDDQSAGTGNPGPWVFKTSGTQVYAAAVNCAALTNQDSQLLPPGCHQDRSHKIDPHLGLEHQ